MSVTLKAVHHPVGNRQVCNINKLFPG